MSDWIDLTPHWARIKEVARERHAQKHRFRSTGRMSHKSHFIGLCGETAYAKAYGLKVDTTLRRHGDDGNDFWGDIDVKTSTFLIDPHLKHRVGSRKWPRRGFVLAVLDEPRKRARLIGYCSTRQLQIASMKDYGYGRQHFLREMSLQHIDCSVPEQHRRQEAV